MPCVKPCLSTYQIFCKKQRIFLLRIYLVIQIKGLLSLLVVWPQVELWDNLKLVKITILP